MLEKNRTQALKWFDEVWNKGRRECIGEMLTPHTVIHDGPSVSHGPQGFYPFFDLLHSTFSGIRLTVVHTIAENNLVCVQWVSTLTHTAQGLGIEPTGKTLKVTGMSIIRFADGEIAEAWQNWDMYGMLQELQTSRPMYLGASA